MTTMRVILNPVADRGHVAERAARLRALITEAAHKANHTIEWCETQHPRHATELARSAAEAAVDVIVVLGGDGTVHEVVNGILTAETAHRPTLAIVPVGSGNDFAANIGIPIDPIKAVRRIFTGEPRAIDAARITDEQGRSEYWNNTLGLGFSGSVNAATRRITVVRGFLIYLLAVLRTVLFNPPDLFAHFELADGTQFKERISMLSVCNGPREGGGFPVAPNARPDDGLLTYTIMKRLGRLGILVFVPIVMAGQHLRARAFLNGHTESLRVTLDGPLDLHIDGEIFATPADPPRTFLIEIIPAALRIMV